jgi:ribose/xylose/arabinose/galactoside ABC-type transport system permease subunit
MTRLLVTLGVVLIIAGLAWPWLSKLGLGRLPGDIVIERENFRFFFPITTMIVISLALSLIFWLFRK